MPVSKPQNAASDRLKHEQENTHNFKHWRIKRICKRVFSESRISETAITGIFLHNFIFYIIFTHIL